MFYSPLGAFVWASVWTAAAWFAVRTPEGEPILWATLAGGVMGFLIWWGTRVAHRKSRPTGAIPLPSSPLPPREFHNDLVDCGDPVDDFLDRWRGHDLPQKERRKRAVVCATPPPCVQEKPEPRFFRVANPRQFPKYVRVYGRGLIYEIVGLASREGFCKVRSSMPGGAIEEHPVQILYPAYPKKGERWFQGACEPCFACGNESVLFMADGAESTHARVRCGCLKPLQCDPGQ